MPSAAEPWATGPGTTTTKNRSYRMSPSPTPDSNAAESASRPSQSPPPPHGLVRILFPLGHLVATPAALRLMERFSIDPMVLVRRHASCDWGDLCAEDVKANNDALIHGLRLLSSYKLSRHAEGAAVTRENVTDTDDTQSAVVWIITEADRSVSTLLTPRCY